MISEQQVLECYEPEEMDAKPIYIMSEGDKIYVESQLKDDVDDIRNSQKMILEILKGKMGTDQPEGLIYTVSKNTDFRKMTTKILWFLFTLISALVINEIFDFFNK